MQVFFDPYAVTYMVSYKLLCIVSLDTTKIFRFYEDDTFHFSNIYLPIHMRKNFSNQTNISSPIIHNNTAATNNLYINNILTSDNSHKLTLLLLHTEVF
jgi:hypothetical protein